LERRKRNGIRTTRTPFTTSSSFRFFSFCYKRENSKRQISSKVCSISAQDISCNPTCRACSTRSRASIFTREILAQNEWLFCILVLMLPYLNLPFSQNLYLRRLLVLAFFWGSLCSGNRFSSLLTKREMSSTVYLSAKIGLLVSRVVYVVMHFKDFGFSILKFILINGYPGLSLYGLIESHCALPLLVYKIKFREATDYFVSRSAHRARISAKSRVLRRGRSRHKTSFYRIDEVCRRRRHAPPHSLYEGLLFFLGAFFAYKLVFAVRRNTYPKGAVGAFFCWYLGLVLSAFELIRGRREIVGTVSV